MNKIISFSSWKVGVSVSENKEQCYLNIKHGSSNKTIKKKKNILSYLYTIIPPKTKVSHQEKGIDSSF